MPVTSQLTFVVSKTEYSGQSRPLQNFGALLADVMATRQKRATIKVTFILIGNTSEMDRQRPFIEHV